MSEKFTGKERDAETGLDYFGARYMSSVQGRWMSADPLLSTLRPENPQTFNRYGYTLNNPLRYVDRTGAYEEDVHRDLTTVLALAAGFDEKTATAIGKADQGVDDDSKTGPFANEAARRNYHFTTVDRRQELWKTFEASGSVNDLVTFMHAEQDSFSHEGFGPKYGHLSARWTPDKTYSDPGKADNMAKDTFKKLSAAAGKLGIKATNRVAFEKIDKLVTSFNKANTAQQKNKILGQIREVIKQVQQEQQQQQVPAAR
jgi:RHS repeat-associated protein